ncbi:APC family permease [Ihubacter massiliensis]|uniref:APC family permease n=1 Tax=Hominibacterium faecale TaxID=2839743 RepID=A0A9J6QS94_9FIRM|nr:MULTISPECIES: APC family permease [Eubacteriales Family XIII. Incertae Sedis]MCO7121354.1 APC family permease [Ihubacter massiliensis]MCU7378340.1 APC family permease [Hominibacterium faecale]
MNEHDRAVQASEPKLKRVLGTPGLVFFGLAFMNITSIILGYAIVDQMTHGMVPLSILISFVVMLITSFSYKQMSMQYPMSGSAYTYTSKAINPYVGFFTGWAILSTYLILPGYNFLLFALYMNVLIPGVPMWVWIVASIVIVGVINFLGIKLLSIVDAIFVVIFAVLLTAIAISAIVHLSGNSTAPGFFDGLANLYKPEAASEVGGMGILQGAAYICFCYLGFDAISTLAEETIDPTKKVGRSMVLSVAIGGAILLLFSFLFDLCWSDKWNMYDNPDTGAIEIIRSVGGDTLGYITSAILVVGVFASVLSIETSATRLLYGMSCDKVMPKFFSKLHPKFKTPGYGIIFVSVLGLLALLRDLEVIVSLLNVGALIAFILVNIAVIAQFWIKKKDRAGFMNKLKYLIAPVIGTLSLAVVLINVGIYGLVLGFVWLLAGFIFLAYRTKMFKELPPTLKGF